MSLSLQDGLESFEILAAGYLGARAVDHDLGDDVDGHVAPYHVSRCPRALRATRPLLMLLAPDERDAFVEQRPPPAPVWLGYREPLFEDLARGSERFADSGHDQLSDTLFR